jgi:hypothetical protein
MENVMSHVDKFGRWWFWKPDHDTNRMVQVPWHLMAIASDAERRIMNQHSDLSHSYYRDWSMAEVPPDCYILKMNDTYHCTGARYGHEGSEYLSSVIHGKPMLDLLIESLRNNPGSMQNFQALCELFPPAGLNINC